MAGAVHSAKAKKQKPTKKEINEAFDKMAQFLFDEYKKYKEEQEVKSPDQKRA